MTDTDLESQRRLASGIPLLPAAARRRLVGVLAAVATVTIWGSWIAVTRWGVTSSLSPYDLAILRFAIPCLVLLPALAIKWRRLPPLRPALILTMAAGAGLPFLLLVASGMTYAPAAHAGSLLPGTMPLFVALLSAALFGERLGGTRICGYFASLAGVVLIGGVGLFVGGAGEWRGHLLFLAGAALWAGYTVAFRRSGLSAWQAAALINGASLLVLAPAYLLGLKPSLLSVSWSELAIQAISQGLLSGLLALFLYGTAVTRLGASQAAAFAALSPVVTTLVAIPLLGEVPQPVTLAGVALVSVGVALSSGALGRSGR